MATGPLAPTPRHQFFTDDGEPLNGGLVYTYEAGTTTESVLYFDAGLASPLADPQELILSDGSAEGGSYLSGPYMAPEQAQKWMLAFGPTPAPVFDPVLSIHALWTVDPVQPVNLLVPTTDVFEYFDFDGNSATSIVNTTYPAGATFDKLHSGTAVLIIDPANIPAGSYVIRAMAKGSTGAIAIDVALMNLSSGAPDTPMVTASGSSATGLIVQSSAITWPAAGTTYRFGIKVKVDAGSATVWSVKLARSGPV